MCPNWLVSWGCVSPKREQLPGHGTLEPAILVTPGRTSLVRFGGASRLVSAVRSQIALWLMVTMPSCAPKRRSEQDFSDEICRAARAELHPILRESSSLVAGLCLCLPLVIVDEAVVVQHPQGPGVRDSAFLGCGACPLVLPPARVQVPLHRNRRERLSRRHRRRRRVPVSVGGQGGDTGQLASFS